MHGIQAPGIKLTLLALGSWLLAASLPAAFSPSSPIAAIWQAQTNLGSPPYSASLPSDAILWETFDRPNGRLGTNLQIASGEWLHFRGGMGGADGCTNAHITNGCLSWYPVDQGAGAFLYCTLTLTNVPQKDYIFGMRYRHILRNWSGSSDAVGIGFAFGNGDGGQWGITNLLARKLVHGGWSAGASLVNWNIDTPTNWVWGNYQDSVSIFSEDLPNRQDARLTNAWHVAEVGKIGPNMLMISRDGYVTNLYGWHVDECWGTNLFFKFDNTTTDPAWLLEIDAIWARPAASRSEAAAMQLAPTTFRPHTVTASGTLGTYYAAQDDFFITMPAGVSNVYLPGGMWVGAPITGSSPRKQPSTGQVIIIQDMNGNAGGTNIHIFGLRYTNDMLWGNSWKTNYVWDRVDNGPSNRITTARGTMRLICRGTNWSSW
jgi:hypothetical protein